MPSNLVGVFLVRQLSGAPAASKNRSFGIELKMGKAPGKAWAIKMEQ